MTKTTTRPTESMGDKEIDRIQLGVRLREIREYLGLSQEEVSEYLQIPRSALSHIENGHRRVDALELKQMAELYKQPVAYFTGEIESREGIAEDVMYLARAAQELSEHDRAELGRFVEYLRARRASEKSSDG